MRQHLIILFFGILCLILGIGFETAGVAEPEWFRNTNNTDAIVVLSLWNRCQEGAALKTPPGDCSKGKVLLFGKDDFTLDLILALHCGSILICLVGLIAALSMFYCRNQRSSWTNCSLLTTSVIFFSAASGMAAVGFNEYNHKEHYRNSYLRGRAYLIAICGVFLIGISDVILVTLIFVKPRKKLFIRKVEGCDKTTTRIGELELK